MALKFVKGNPTTEGLYAFSYNGKNTDFYAEINSNDLLVIKVLFYCYLGPIPVIEPVDNLKRLFIDKIAYKLIDIKPIVVKSKDTGKIVDTIVPFSITKKNSEVFINNTYGALSYDFWEKVE